MSDIEMVKIRAKIEIGNSLTIETPYIQSLNVRKARGQSSTFDASLKVKHTDIKQNNLGGNVIVYAGRDNTNDKIFTGIIKKASISPCWDDPGFVFLNLSGSDVSSLLQGKKYTRRCRATKGTWISIDNVIRKGLRAGKFAFKLNTIRLDSALAADQIIESDRTKKQGNKIASAPKTKAPSPVLAKITVKPVTGNLTGEAIA